MRDSFLIFGSPLIDQPEIDEVVDSLKSGWLCSGYKVQRLENMFKEYKDVGFAAAVSSCTAALHLSMLAIGIEPGDEVIVPDMTFGATANAVIHAGGRPVLADCKKDSMNIDPAEIERRVTPKTKAIILVHFAGRACEMDPIMSFAETAGLAVIEDCAHAIETEYHGRKTGTFGEIGCFSFYANKNIATGEGGMLITNNERYADKVKILALHGMTKDAWKRFSDEGYKHYQYVCCGYKYSMMDLQAAIAIHQLPRVDAYWERRREIWGAYMEALQDLPVILPAPIEQGTRHAYHLFTLLLKLDDLDITRDQFLDRMTGMNIGVGVHYVALHLHPFYQQAFGYRNGDFPNAEWISERTVSIPLSPKLTDDDVQDVIGAVRAILLEGAK